MYLIVFVRHLFGNFKKEFKGSALNSLFWKATKCNYMKDIEEVMTDINRSTVGACQYLSGHAFPYNSKCDFVLYNLS